MRQSLAETPKREATPPVERRKLRTVTTQCGQRANLRFLEMLDGRLAEAGIYAEPRLADLSLRLDDWVLFSTGPFPPDSAFFPKEKDLQKFVESCLGTGNFKNLERLRLPGRSTGREFRLPSGERIDILCQERTRYGAGALVAIELKRDHERGTVEQMVGYLDALRELFPSRPVRGIIISGREERVAAEVLKQHSTYQIEWLCYQVEFKKVANSTIGSPTA